MAIGESRLVAGGLVLVGVIGERKKSCSSGCNLARVAS